MQSLPAPPPLTAVIVTYQSQQTIAAALDSLQASREAGLLDVIVVDNGSSDGTRALLADRARWAKVILGENIGFGRGCNVALEQVQTEFVIFINPDAEISTDALRVLLDFMESHPQAGVAAPAVLGPNGECQHAGTLPTPSLILRTAAPLIPKASLRTIVPGDPPAPTDWVCGAVMMCRTRLLRELGGFDPRFFLYYEETDLCRRALRRGYEIWTVGQAVARHVGSASSSGDEAARRIAGCLADHLFRSRFYYLSKHYGLPVAGLTELAELALLTLNTCGRWIARRPGNPLADRLQGPLFRLPPRVMNR